jgi:hypothetical protein
LKLGDAERVLDPFRPSAHLRTGYGREREEKSHKLKEYRMMLSILFHY